MELKQSIAEVGDVRRFPSRHHFASYTGTARSTCPPERTTAIGSTAAAGLVPKINRREECFQDLQPLQSCALLFDVHTAHHANR
jgi:hypothetical protein